MPSDRCQVYRCLQALVLTVYISPILNKDLGHFLRARLYSEMKCRTAIQVTSVDELFEVRAALWLWNGRGLFFEVMTNCYNILKQKTINWMGSKTEEWYSSRKQYFVKFVKLGTSKNQFKEETFSKEKPVHYKYLLILGAQQNSEIELLLKKLVDGFITTFSNHDLFFHTI